MVQPFPQPLPGPGPAGGRARGQAARAGRPGDHARRTRSRLRMHEDHRHVRRGDRGDLGHRPARRPSWASPTAGGPGRRAQAPQAGSRPSRERASSRCGSWRRNGKGTFRLEVTSVEKASRTRLRLRPARGLAQVRHRGHDGRRDARGIPGRAARREQLSGEPPHPHRIGRALRGPFKPRALARPAAPAARGRRLVRLQRRHPRHPPRPVSRSAPAEQAPRGARVLRLRRDARHLPDGQPRPGPVAPARA